MSVQDIINEHAGLTVEYFPAKNGFPQSIWESYSAMANTNGGILIVGASSNGHTLNPDGLDEQTVAHYKKEFCEEGSDTERVSSFLLVDQDMQDAEDETGNHFLVLIIPRADYSRRPVYLNQKPFGNTFKRGEEGHFRCTDEEVMQMFSDADLQKNPSDGRILPSSFAIADLDPVSVSEYRRLFDLRNENHPWSKLDIPEFLKKIGAYRVDSKKGEEGLTLAGMLLLGKSERIVDPYCAPWYFVDYRERMLLDKVRWTNRIVPDGTWEANLFQFYFRVLPLLQQSLPVPFKLVGDGRTDATPAHEAVREALANCLIHGRWDQMGNIVVERTPKYLKFTNMGTMLISVDEFYKGGHSICRNPYLQRMFMYMGRGEKAGSGAATIVNGWASNKWEKPVITEYFRPDCVEMIMQLSDLNEMALSEEKEIEESTVVAEQNTPQPEKQTVLNPQPIQKVEEEKPQIVEKKVTIDHTADADPLGFAREVIKVMLEELSGNWSYRILYRIVSDWDADILATILPFCYVPRSKNEIVQKAVVLESRTLTRNYLQPLLELGFLQMTYPDNHKNKHQEYVATVCCRAMLKKYQLI